MNRSRFTDIICAMVQLNSKISPHTVAASSAIDTANHPEIVELLKQSNTESKGEWVSVDERLPPIGRYNTYNGGTVASSSYIADGHGLSFDGWVEMNGVTHWQPLPQPPKQGSQS